MKTSPHVITLFWVLFLGLILGSAFGVMWFEGKINAQWALVAAATGGPIISVLGVAWFNTIKGYDERRRKQRAALFLLANALTEVCYYAKSGMIYHVDLRNRNGDFVGKIPQSAIDALKDVTEWFEGRESKAAGDIGPKYQLCRARSRSSFGNPAGRVSIELVCDFAELHALASRLFCLARGEDEQVAIGRITREEMHSAFGISDDILFPWFQEREPQEHLDRRYGPVL